MSCHCNKCVQICNPCPPTSPQPCPQPCQQSCPQQTQLFPEFQQNQWEQGQWNGNNNCGCGQCGNNQSNDQREKRCGQCGHRKCQCDHKEKRCDRCNHRRCRCEKDQCDRCGHTDCRCEKSSDKHCNKCGYSKCRCVKIVPFLRVKCGCVSASLTKTADPIQVSAVGQLITYSYTITNTGNVPICYPIQICDDILGGQFIPGSFILPGQSQTYTRTYTTIESDLLAPIVNIATAYIQVECKKWVCTNQASATISIGGADLTGLITQGITGSSAGTTGTVIVNVAITNLPAPSSAIPGTGVTLFLPFPFGIVSATAISPNVIVSSGGVTISIPSIAVGQSILSQFSYVGTIPGVYTWSGVIQSTSFDPNLANNNVNSTVILP